jgi:hypothetical protein
MSANRCADEPWPCYRADCTNGECVNHRRKYPDCKGYACNCVAVAESRAQLKRLGEQRA